jgi:hypothetical protein
MVESRDGRVEGRSARQSTNDSAVDSPLENVGGPDDTAEKRDESVSFRTDHKEELTRRGSSRRGSWP